MAKHQWTEEEKDKIKKIYNLYTKNELAELFNTTVKSIEYILIKLDLYTKKKKVKDGYKICSNCKEELPIEMFNKRNKNDPDNTLKRQCYCKHCSKIIKHVNGIKRKENQEKDIKEKIISDYIEKNKGKTFFCKLCNKEHTIDDFIIYINNRYPNTPHKICRHNRLEKRRKALIKRKAEKFNNI